MEPGYVLAFLFFIVLLALRAYVQYKKELAQEQGADVSDYQLSDVERIMSIAASILEKKNSFYKRLSDPGKLKFRRRLRVVLANKTFYAKDGLNLTDEMTVIAASAFVQIAFGMKHNYLLNFSKIYIYPDLFFNKLLDRNLKGSTSPLGIIRLSWKHLEYGFARDDDGINLALHELAHAFKITVESDHAYDAKLLAAMQDVKHIGKEVRQDILDGKTQVLRKYASVNEHEFFACAVEVFFENPEELKSDRPNLFLAMVNLFGLDTSNTLGDYAAPLVKHKFNFKTKLAPKPDNMYGWFQWMMAIGLVFFLLPYFMIILHAQASPIPTLLFAATILVIGGLLFFRRLVLSGYTTVGIFIVFLAIGWFPLIAGPALALNYLIPVHRSYELVEPKTIVYVSTSEYRVIPKDTNQQIYEVDGSIAQQLRIGEDRVKLKAWSHYGVFGLKVQRGFKVIYESDMD